MSVDENKRLVRRYYEEVVNTGNADRIVCSSHRSMPRCMTENDTRQASRGRRSMSSACAGRIRTCTPPIARVISKHEKLRALTPSVLAPIVYALKYPLAPLFVVIIGGTLAVLKIALRRRWKKAVS